MFCRLFQSNSKYFTQSIKYWRKNQQFHVAVSFCPSALNLHKKFPAFRPLSPVPTLFQTKNIDDLYYATMSIANTGLNMNWPLDDEKRKKPETKWLALLWKNVQFLLFVHFLRQNKKVEKEIIWKKKKIRYRFGVGLLARNHTRKMKTKKKFRYNMVDLDIIYRFVFFYLHCSIEIYGGCTVYSVYSLMSI